MTSTRLVPGALKDINREEVDQKIRAAVPMSNNVRKRPALNMEREFPWEWVQKELFIFMSKFNGKFGTSFSCPTIDYWWFQNMCKRVGVDENYAVNSIGTLGGGNHFIEVGMDDDEYPWITVHSGSRNLGLKAANYWQKKAISKMTDVRAMTKRTAIKELKDSGHPELIEDRVKEALDPLKCSKELAYLNADQGDELIGYLVDAVFLNFYASENRSHMMASIHSALELPEVIEGIETVGELVSDHCTDCAVVHRIIG